ncbi:hypothetical protein CISIN_1g041884mg [Citrus sinensis]|uniref:Uncharacterized protein n=1 Tax=Citrus sinensis TaxID=2711 RepID=A0A067FW76_CITSI|nr:hypothetical protein CISIN_1g041884mg [Citrus sinensis]
MNELSSFLKHCRSSSLVLVNNEETVVHTLLSKSLERGGLWEELIRGCFAAAMNVSHVDLLVNNNVLKPLIFDVM